jgi:hypothetical protein
LAGSSESPLTGSNPSSPSLPCEGKADVHPESAVRSTLSADDRVVCPGDRLHDGESEPDAASAETRLRVESLEWQEEARELAGRNEGPRVRDREQRAFCGRVGCELDAAAGDVVADGVGKEVRDEALDELRLSGPI